MRPCPYCGADEEQSRCHDSGCPRGGDPDGEKLLDPLDDDRDQRNPGEDVDWGKVYSRMDDFEDFLDHDHSMDY